MSGRCVCCNRILLRTTGKRKLEDGTLVEETFCNVCRNEVNQILRDDSYSKNAKFEGIVEQQMFYGCVTPQKNPVYQEIFMSDIFKQSMNIIVVFQYIATVVMTFMEKIKRN